MRLVKNQPHTVDPVLAINSTQLKMKILEEIINKKVQLM